MTSKIRSRIKQFLKSEGGRVGIKTPLALGIASGNLLLAQVIFADDADSDYECHDDGDCGSDEVCAYTPQVGIDGETYWTSACVEGT